MAEKSDNRTPSYLLISALVLLAVVFVAVMFSDVVEDCIRPFSGVSTNTVPNKIEECVGQLLGLPGKKNEILIFLGISMGGILLTLQAWISYKRARAMEDTAKAQAKATVEQAKANQNTEKGLRQERLKNAIEHLGNDSDSVRLGGAYELFHLAQDTKEEALQRMYSSGSADERFHLAQNTPDLRQTVLDILCAHIRRTTGEDEYRKAHQSKPSEEVQSLLTLLFVQKHDVFKGLPINLQNSWLNGANLRRARLQKANLTRASLKNTWLVMAHMQGTDLREAHLEKAVLTKAWLQGADLDMAHLQRTNFKEANLQGVNLWGAHLQAAFLPRAHLQGANLDNVRLPGSMLSEVCLQGTSLSLVYLQEAILDRVDLRGAGTGDWSSSMTFAERIRNSIGKESNLSGVFFSGGIDRNIVDRFCENCSGEDERSLRQGLEHHINKQVSHEPPEKSGAITGTYTKEEAEKWIAEYEKAMSEVPTADE